MPTAPAKVAATIKPYSECSVLFCVNPGRKVKQGLPRRGPLTAADMKQLLGFETEKDYIGRTGNEKFPESLPIPVIKDTEGNNFVCWKNAGNRPFDREWALSRAQDMLLGKWRFNMEPFEISDKGNVVSGQHRGCGLIFADQLYNGKQKLHWQSVSKTPPMMECIIAFGVEEKPDVLQTLDNTKPRSDADVIYTSDLFAKLSFHQRRECSRMQASAIDLVWKRSGAGKGGDVWNKYRTRSTTLDFLERHKRLTECVHHLYSINQKREITTLRITAGQAAGMMYLMAAGLSDADLYTNGDRCERDMNFDLWDQSKQFWTLVATRDKSVGVAVDEALKLFVDPTEGMGGRLVEKIAIIALAWRTWLDNGKRVVESDLINRDGGYVRPRLQYTDDRKALVDPETFRGIDEGNDRDTKSPIATKV